LILDEPSAILDPPEVDALFAVVRRLTAAGVGVVYISHRLDEIARIGDRITVLRDGKTVATNLPATTGVDPLIQLMIGRGPRELFPKRNTPPGEVVLRVRALARPPHLADTSFEVRAGEIKIANRDKEMWLTGVGGSKAAMEQIKQGGLYRATFLYNPTMAASAVALARLLAKGQGLSDLTEPVIPNLIVMQAQGVFKDNVDRYMAIGF
jgi:ribose transport system ATP-binding protein